MRPSLAVFSVALFSLLGQVGLSGAVLTNYTIDDSNPSVHYDSGAILCSASTREQSKAVDLDICGDLSHMINGTYSWLNGPNNVTVPFAGACSKSS